MRLCLLLYCCVFFRSNGENPDHFVLSVPQSNRRSIPSSRLGHDRDLMVVLPVMQGDPDISNSNLQYLYTKAPITAIIGGENSHHPRTLQTQSTTSKTIERRIDLAAAAPPKLDAPAKRLPDRSPYAGDFSAGKTTPKSYKLPLDYGYPDSFKFVQELNELPKNHKPEWASSEQVEPTYKEATIGFVTSTPAKSTKDDPFQMFESVKPLEINKLLSLKQSAIGVTDSLFEENVTKKKHQESTKRPLTKQPLPSKKPQKTKTNGYKIGAFGQAPIIIDLGTTWRPSRPVFMTAEVTSRVDPIPPQYSTVFETSKFFLPTPYAVPFESPTTKKMETTSTSRPSTTTESTTTIRTVVTTTNATLAPNFAWTNVTAAAVTTSNPILKSAISEVKPSDLVSLNKLLAADYVPGSTSVALRDITTKHPFPKDDLLTNDMKNMLIALGILRAENNEPTFAVLTTPSTSTTKNILAMLANEKSITPTIDPYSYVSFKKIPDNLSVGDDMRDFLTSFGLLPKQTPSNRGGFRQQRWLEILSNLKSKKVRNSHIFHPMAKLYDKLETRKINDAVDAIRKLSTKNATSLTVERLERQLQDAIASLRRKIDKVSAESIAINETTTTPFSRHGSNRSFEIAESNAGIDKSNLVPASSRTLSSKELSKINESSMIVADSNQAESNDNKFTSDMAKRTGKSIGQYFYVDWNTFLKRFQNDKDLFGFKNFTPIMVL